jgi:hypothetical protein
MSGGKTTNTKGKTMNYPLNPTQKAILASEGMDVNFKGDDNDFGCLLSQIALARFMSGNVLGAWECYQNDPTACYGATFDAWESSMKTIVIRHLQSEKATEAHERSIQNAAH